LAAEDEIQTQIIVSVKVQQQSFFSICCRSPSFLQVSLVLTDESLCQCLAAELSLYVMQISNVFSSSLFFSFFPFSLCLLICSVFPFFSLFLFPFSEGFHSNEKMKEKLSPPLHMAGGSLI
jgi:hypothetical protein